MLKLIEFVELGVDVVEDRGEKRDISFLLVVGFFFVLFGG